jgi:cytochrome c biogenesis protein CcmG/thiol:disulfide interchange protein DsbE
MKLSMWLSRLLVASAALSAGAIALAQAPVVGKPISAFSMRDLSGKTHTDKTLRGRVVLIDFWATWCGPCKKASPIMERLHKTYGKRGLTVIGANVEGIDGDASKLVRDYRAKHKYTYTFTVGNEDLGSKWNVEGIPTFILIDKKGIVRQVQVGTGPSWDKNLENLIKASLK